MRLEDRKWEVQMCYKKLFLFRDNKFEIGFLILVAPTVFKIDPLSISVTLSIFLPISFCPKNTNTTGPPKQATQFKIMSNKESYLSFSNKKSHLSFPFSRLTSFPIEIYFNVIMFTP